MIDEKLYKLEAEETHRLNDDIELIASENYPSQDILDLMGSHLSVKYAEGNPPEVTKMGRHYAGCEVINKVENYAIEQACMLFGCKYANVQPWSGSQANLAVYASLLKPGDSVLAMSVDAGGHISHFSVASDSNKEYKAHFYGLDKKGYLDYNDLDKKLYEYTPRLLVVGASAYSQQIEFDVIKGMLDCYNEFWRTIINNAFLENGWTTYEKKEQTLFSSFQYNNRFHCPGFQVKQGDTRETIYERSKCYLMVDMAHIAGLVATGYHPSPIPYADVVTSTTHKTLRGPRGGLILWNDSKLCNKLNNGVFPRTQGGPNEAAIAAKCQCFIEAQKPEFKAYIYNVLSNMQALIKGIKAADDLNLLEFISGGSHNHLVLLNIKKLGIYGKEAEDRLTSYGIICNKNMIDGDLKPAECTGLRFGTAAITTRGFDNDMCYELGRIITQILTMHLHPRQEDGTIDFEDKAIRKKLKDMMDKVGPFYKENPITKPTNPQIPDTLA